MDVLSRPLPLLGALALALSVPATAGGESSDDSWLELDNEISASDESLVRTDDKDVIRYGGLVRAFYSYSDADVVTAGGKSVSGVSVNDADIFAEAQFERFRVRVSGDLAEDFEVEDAFGEWEVVEDYVFLRVGRFKPHILRSASMDPEKLVFKERTLLGTLLDQWQDGAEIEWGWEPWEFYGSVSNGETGQEPHHMYTFRMDWDFYDPWLVPYEGGHTAPIYARWKVGFAWYTETSVHDDTGLGGDAALSLGPWSFHFEYMHLYDGAGGPIDGLRLPTLTFEGDSDPYAVTAGYCFDDRWQGNLRFQAMDNTDDTFTYGASINYYPFQDSWYNWVLDVAQVDSESDDGFLAQFGVSVGSTR